MFNQCDEHPGGGGGGGGRGREREGQTVNIIWCFFEPMLSVPGDSSQAVVGGVETLKPGFLRQNMVLLTEHQRTNVRYAQNATERKFGLSKNSAR